MKRSIQIACVIIMFAAKGHAQTFPATYPAISGVISPASGSAVLPTDFLGVNRVMSCPIGPCYTYVGVLPLSDFASSTDIASTNSALSATNTALSAANTQLSVTNTELSATNSVLSNSTKGIAAALGG